MSRTAMQNTRFFQTKQNELKMGAYYTDVEEMMRIRNLFDFSKVDQICALDPCVGNGDALLEIIGHSDNVKTYGVELNTKTYKQLLDESEIENVVNADFLQEVKITNNAFSFVFMNPPYGTTSDRQRFEFEFLKRVIKYISEEGVFVYVVPYYIFHEEERLAAAYCTNFELKHIYKFHADEFELYKQIILVGTKKTYRQRDENMEAHLLGKINKIDDLEVVPDSYDEVIQVPKSSADKIKIFDSDRITAFDAMRASKKSKLYDLLHKRCRIDSIMDIGTPPLPLREDHAYLLAATGYTEGLIGSEENGDLHLQRGILEKGIQREHIYSESGNHTIKEKTLYKTGLTTIESDGTIKRYEA